MDIMKRKAIKPYTIKKRHINPMAIKSGQKI